MERNDRIVAIVQANHSYAHVRHVADLGKTFTRELEEFFVDYHRLSEEHYRIQDIRSLREARRRIKGGMRAFRKKRG